MKNLPKEAVEGPYALGSMIVVNRDSIAEKYRNPDLPQWFPARVCMPPGEAGNWYRWYDPFIWYETEGDVFNATPASGIRNKCYVGNLWYGRNTRKWWAQPIAMGLPAEGGD